MSEPKYNENIPQAQTTFDEWQVLFLANFQKMDEAFKANHVALTSASNAGNHTFIQLFEQENALQTNIGDFAVYAKEVEDQSDQTFIRYEGNGTEFQYTNYQLYPIDATINQEAYFTVLPGRLMVFFGKFIPLKTTMIFLNPPVAKNLLSVSFTPIDTTVPFLTYTEVKNKEFITSLDITVQTVAKKAEPIPTLYYCVVANI